MHKTYAYASAISQPFLSAGFPAAFFNLSNFYFYFWLKSKSFLCGFVRSACKSCSTLIIYGEKCFPKLLDPCLLLLRFIARSCDERRSQIGSSKHARIDRTNYPLNDNIIDKLHRDLTHFHGHWHWQWRWQWHCCNHHCNPLHSHH